jgi:hypothetical protein
MLAFASTVPEQPAAFACSKVRGRQRAIEGLLEVQEVGFFRARGYERIELTPADVAETHAEQGFELRVPYIHEADDTVFFQEVPSD